MCRKAYPVLNRPPFNLIRTISACYESANAKCPTLTTRYIPSDHEEGVTKRGTKLIFSNRISTTKAYGEGKIFLYSTVKEPLILPWKYKFTRQRQTGNISTHVWSQVKFPG